MWTLLTSFLDSYITASYRITAQEFLASTYAKDVNVHTNMYCKKQQRHDNGQCGCYIYAVTSDQ